MFLLLESICWNNGEMPLLGLHLNRMNTSRKKLLHITDPITLPLKLEPPSNLNKKWKLRVLYSRKIEKIEWIPYTKVNPQKILVLNPGPLSYCHKFADRKQFNLLKSQYPGFDDYLILQDGKLTDGSYSNILLKIKGEWITPSTPLLKGVRREALITSGQITEKLILEKDLLMASEIKLINAMLPFEDAIVVQPNMLFFQNRKKANS